MTEDLETDERSSLWLSLQRLTSGLGVHRVDLLEVLQGELSELRDCWQVNLSNGLVGARRIVTANLSAHIDRLHLPAIRQPLSNEDRQKQYRHAIGVSFNIYGDAEHVELLSQDIMGRREWLASEERGTRKVMVRTAQRYLNHAITQIEQQILASGYEAIEAEAPLVDDEVVLRPRQGITPDSLIPRPSCVNQFFKVWQGAPGNDLPVLCIWGEPGTGKTTLAHQVLRVLFADRPEIPPIATLRAGHPAQLRDDITSLLLFEGMEPTNWTDSYAQAMVRQRFSSPSSGTPRVRAIVIDNVEDEELITQLVPEKLRVPFVITMRDKPCNPRIASMQLHSFTEEQSVTFINNMLGAVDEIEARALSSLFGGRPLALDHATRFIRESPDISLREIISTLSRGLASGFDLVASAVDSKRNLVELYKLMLTPLTQNENTRYILDSFLAITGANGGVNREALFDFLSSKFGGSCERVHFRAALRTLDSHGLIREAGIAHPKVDHFDLTMHPFTFAILRELRGLKPLLSIEAKYFLYLSSPAVLDLIPGLLDLEPAEQNRHLGRLQAGIHASALEIMRHSLPSGWETVMCIDELTWVATFKQEEDQGGEQHYVVRYEIRPDAVYKLDYRTGERSKLTGAEVLTLFEVAFNYRSAMRRVTDPLADPTDEERHRLDPLFEEMGEFIARRREQEG